MKQVAAITLTALIVIATTGGQTPTPQFRDLFNGKDLTGWVNVNTNPDTWHVKDGMIICSGKPNGVMRTEKEYENFILHVEWMHMEPGGHSGVFAWSSEKAMGSGRF